MSEAAERFANKGGRPRCGAEMRYAKKLRPILVDRQRNKCHYCRRRMTPIIGHPLRRTDATVEHLKPRVEGGGLSLENCVAACFACNVHQAYVRRGKAYLRYRMLSGLRRLEGWLADVFA